MNLNAHVDVDLVAVEQPDELTVLLELRAPEAPQAQGDVLAARAAYREAAADIEAASPSPELAEEAVILGGLDAQVAGDEERLAAKMSWMQHARKSRRRGRRGPEV